MTSTSRMLYDNHYSWRQKSIHPKEHHFACVSEDTSWILAVWDQARLVCVVATQLESICHNQIFQTTKLPFCYGNHNFATYSHMKAALLDRRNHWTGRTIHGRSFCLSLTSRWSCPGIRLDGRLCNCHCRWNCYCFRKMIAFLPYWFGRWQRWNRRFICFEFLSVAARICFGFLSVAVCSCICWDRQQRRWSKGMIFQQRRWEQSPHTSCVQETPWCVAGWQQHSDAPATTSDSQCRSNNNYPLRKMMTVRATKTSF